MRIRNSRSNFAQMTLPETTPRAAHLRSPEGSDDRFLVEEENRHIGWSCHTKKQFPAEVSSEDQLHDELEAASSTEIRPLNCVDKGKDVKHYMQMDTNPASEGQSEGEADNGKQFTACAGSQGGGENVTSPVTAGIAHPCSFSHLGQKLPFKKRRPYSHTATEVEMEREKVEDVYLEEKVEDAVMEAKEKCMPVEIEKENHFAEVKEDEPVKVEAEDAVADKKEESLEGGEIREETVEETEKTSELELVNEGLYVPHLTIDENQQDSKNEELNLEETDLEETAGEPNEKPRRGRKTPRSSASTSSDEPHQGRQKLKRGSPKRMQDPAEANQGCVEKQKPIRGRPNRGNEESSLSNNRYPRRGRSQRDTEESFPSNNRKPRRGRPKRSTEESPHSNNRYPRRGRSKRNTEESFPSNSRKPRRGRPKRSAEESPHSNSGYSLDTEESSPSNNRKPRRGRPKRSTGKSPHSNNRNAEMPKPKRGRPKRVKE